MPSQPLIRFFFALLFPLPALAGDINEELLAAARKSDVEAVKALLAKGADVNAKTAYGATALSYAADKGHVEVVKVLLDRGADVNVKDTFYGETPLGWAAYRGHATVVTLLLDKGAAAKDGALMAGVYQGHVEVVKAVLEKGGAKTETLSSALETATKSGRPEIIELLKKAGAVPPPKADFQVDPEVLKTYTGTYKKQDGTEFTISLREGKLEGEVEGFSSALEAIDQVTFKPLEFGGITITFVLEEGKVAALKLKEGEEDSTFKKVGGR
jgi:Ankyrin repeats (3 copies)/Domain of unknown function (DUF3471)